MDKQIEYWSKHQELDKFNYNSTFTSYLQELSVVVTVLIGSLGMILAYEPIDPTTRLVLIVLVGITVLAYLNFKVNNSYIKKLKEHNHSFRIREVMLRVMYQNQKIDTDLLDSQFEEIKRKSKSISENKKLELIAKEVINNSKKMNRSKE